MVTLPISTAAAFFAAAAPSPWDSLHIVGNVLALWAFKDALCGKRLLQLTVRDLLKALREPADEESLLAKAQERAATEVEQALMQELQHLQELPLPASMRGVQAAPDLEVPEDEERLLPDAAEVAAATVDASSSSQDADRRPAVMLANVVAGLLPLAAFLVIVAVHRFLSPVLERPAVAQTCSALSALGLGYFLLVCILAVLLVAKGPTTYHPKLSTGGTFRVKSLTGEEQQLLHQKRRI